MKMLARIMWSAIAAIIGYGIAGIACEAYIKMLKNTQGLILAKDYAEAELLPVCIAIIIGCVVFGILTKEK